LIKKLKSEEAADNAINSMIEKVKEARIARNKGKEFSLVFDAETEIPVYNATDIHEFLVGMFFDPELQNILNNTEYKQSKKSIFEKFINILGRIFFPNLNNDNLLKAGIQSLVEYLNEINPKAMENIKGEFQKSLDKLSEAVLEAEKIVKSEGKMSGGKNMMSEDAGFSENVSQEPSDINFAGIPKDEQEYINQNNYQYNTTIDTHIELNNKIEKLENVINSGKLSKEDYAEHQRNLKYYKNKAKELKYQFGESSSKLQQAGIPIVDIELAGKVLYEHSLNKNHPFSLNIIKELVQAVQNPMAVFKSNTENEDFVILTDIYYKGDAIIVSIKIENDKGKITAVYPPTDGNGIKMLNYLKWGLLLKADESKIKEWFPVQSHHALSGTGIHLNKRMSINEYNSLSETNRRIYDTYKQVAKIIQNLDSSKLFQENFEKNSQQENISDIIPDISEKLC